MKNLTIDISDKHYQIFDRTLKRTMYLSNPTVILLINALFGTNYPPDSTIEHLSTENITDTLNQWVSDMLLLINHTDKYHIEAQISDDDDMGLRVFNYDYLEAVKTKIVADTAIKLLFAQSMVIYLESTALTPAELSVTLTFSDKSVHTFVVPTFKLLDYSIADLEQRNMSVLLPLYLLKMRKRVKRAKSSKRRRELSVDLQNLVEEIMHTIERSEQNGQMSKSDMRTVMGLMGMIYADLYKSYPEFKETNMIVDEMLLTIVDEAEIAAEARGKAEGAAMGKTERSLEIAQKMIRKGWAKEEIAETTELDLATVESLYQNIGAR